jgi:hypothetical protein
MAAIRISGQARRIAAFLGAILDGADLCGWLPPALYKGSLEGRQAGWAGTGRQLAAREDIENRGVGRGHIQRQLVSSGTAKDHQKYKLLPSLYARLTMKSIFFVH